MNIMEMHDDKLQSPIKYFIDCPLDSEMSDSVLKRIEIPRELGRYIQSLQREVASLKNKHFAVSEDNKKLKKENTKLNAHIEQLRDAITILGDLVMVFDEGYVRFNDDDWNKFMAVCSETPAQSLTEIKSKARNEGKKLCVCVNQDRHLEACAEASRESKE